MKGGDLFAKKIRNDFPIFRNVSGLVYLDNAATTQRLKCVIDKIKEFYENENANIHRGIYSLSEDATEKYEQVRTKAADFINAEADEIVFVKNTTEAINLLAYSIDSIIGDKRNEIVISESEHHSNLVSWQELAKRKNWDLKVIKLKDDLTLDYEEAKKLISERTAVVSIGHVSNVTGAVNDVEKIIELAKKNGVLVIVDSAQSISHKKIDVKKMGCDFLAFSSHKMFGPMGVGVLFGKKNLLEVLPPFLFGGGMIKNVSLNNAEWADLPLKFEAGTQNIGEVLGFGEALKYLKKVGFDKIIEWEKKLLDYTFCELKKISEIDIYEPKSDKISIISFNVKGVHCHDVAQILAEENICVRAGAHCAIPLIKKIGVEGVVRASFSFYNTYEDVDKFILGLKKVVEVFKK